MKQEAQLSQSERASNIALSYGAKGISICCYRRARQLSSMLKKVLT